MLITDYQALVGALQSKKQTKKYTDPLDLQTAFCRLILILNLLQVRKWV